MNDNFGSGSSREHAPQALKRRGIAACVGQSFSEIFLGNATTIGLVCATAGPDDIAFLQSTAERDPSARMTLSVESLTIEAAGRTVPLVIPAAVRDALLTGQWDATGLLLDNFDEVRRVAGALPYATRF